MTDPDESRDPLDLLAEEFLSRLRDGESVTPESFAAEHGDHGPALLELLPTLLVLEQARRDRESSSTGQRRATVPKLERLGDYRIVREIGRGGMGVVFEAVQESLGRRVALKVLPQTRLFTGNQLERFRREAQTAARLHHTNIVPVFDSGDADGFHYYAMQFIDGRGLDAIVHDLKSAAGQVGSDDSTGIVEPASAMRDDRDRCCFAARVGAEVAEALQHAHDLGTMHRDIKPANLLLDDHGHVWVTDFGLAKALEDDALTHSGDVLGTLQYMAPEQFAGDYDPRSEVYALGLTLHEIVTLRPAFAASSRAELIENIRSGRRERTRRFCPGLSRDLETVLERAMATAPEARYASAGELAADLRAFLEDRPIAARRQSPRELLVYWCRRNRALAAVGAVALLAVLAAAVIGWSAYWLTDSALEREAASSKREAIARDLADANVALALEAFEDVFDSLVGPDPLHALLADVEEEQEEPDAVVALRAPVDVGDVALLHRILEFYDRFAANNATNSLLRGEAARAYRRVGAIQARFGDLEAAMTAYQKAESLYRDTHERDVTRDLAALLQELGQVQVRRGLAREASRSFIGSLQVLGSDLTDTSRSARWLTARAHYLLATVHTLRPGSRRPMGGREGGRREERPGDWRGREGSRRSGRPRDGRGRSGRPGRPSPRPPGQEPSRPRFERSRTLAREHLTQSRELLEELLRERPEDAESLFLSSRCMLAEARVQRRPAGSAVGHEFDAAIEILEQLVERYPRSDVYRFELCEAILMEGRLRRSRPSAAILATVHDHAAELVRQHPLHPEYQSLRARVLRDRAMQLAPSDRLGAIAQLRAALEIQKNLAERPDARSRFVESVLVTGQHLAALLLEDGQTDAARSELDQAFDLAAGLAQKGRLPRPLMGRQFLSLVERLGLRERYEELRSLQVRRGR